jgi:hypothetical protein
VQVHDGFLKEISNPFYKATRGLASLDTKISVITTSTSSPSFADSKYIILPNPNYGKFTLNIKGCQSKNLIVRILNDLGIVVLIRNVNAVTNNYLEEFDISGMPKATYFIQISDGRNWESVKFILR